MKKLFSLTVVLLLAMSILTVPSMAAGENDGGAYGYLSYLSMTEADYVSRHEAERPAFDYLEEHGVLESVDRGSPRTKMIAYDSLDALFMALQTGEINAVDVPSCTARYMCAVNDQVKQAVLYHPEKAQGFSQDLLDRLCSGYSFMMLEENTELRDQFNEAISAMKTDGALDRLIKEQIDDVIAGKDAVPIEMPVFEGAKTVRIGVTGAIPPMDYMTPYGIPAGFNTAVLAEIGTRTGVNVELVQVDSVSRALALSQGYVDAVFWTRGSSEGMVRDGISSMSEEELKAYQQKKTAEHTEEENAIMSALRRSFPFEEYACRDMPEGAIVTVPYYTDLNVLVVRK